MRRQDRRRFQRVPVSLLGRFMLEDRKEYPCQTIDMSPGSAAITTPIMARLGERVVAYIDHVGRIEGEVIRQFDGGFAITITATLRKKDKLAAKLTWLANRHELSLPEDRRHDRIVPEVPVAPVTLPDERVLQCRIVDLSLSGAALHANAKPPIGAPVTIGSLRARVVRHFEEGFAIEFAVLQTKESIHENIR
ncbi:PilZ domain-containing protein [Bauldia litoralis]|nr:PilZ domain-containing protein [Bauldia litoralis]